MPNDGLAPHSTAAGPASSPVDVLPAPLTDAAIDTVVVELNAIHRATSFACARQIGRLLLERFYGGDVHAWHSRAEMDAPGAAPPIPAS